MGWIVKLLLILKDDFGIKIPMKFVMPLNKVTKS